MTRQADPYRKAREAMVKEQLAARGIRDSRVLDAMLRVPRHEFIEPALRSYAYGDHPLKIAFDQTISQPFIVAYMLQWLALHREDTVLEVGAGSGYVTALLSGLCRHVYSVERHAPLVRQAEDRLAFLGVSNVTILVGDGSQGWEAHAPYDGILVSAAALSVPEPLFQQLREGGRLVIPVGLAEEQYLQIIRKREGARSVQQLDACRFVPLVEDGPFRASS
jgi:protein-L-isoaspartate(D-aspartate) O-methyltransferase